MYELLLIQDKDKSTTTDPVLIIALAKDNSIIRVLASEKLGARNFRAFATVYAVPEEKVDTVWEQYTAMPGFVDEPPWTMDSIGLFPKEDIL